MLKTLVIFLSFLINSICCGAQSPVDCMDDDELMPLLLSKKKMCLMCPLCAHPYNDGDHMCIFSDEDSSLQSLTATDQSPGGDEDLALRDMPVINVPFGQEVQLPIEVGQLGDITSWLDDEDLAPRDMPVFNVPGGKEVRPPIAMGQSGDITSCLIEEALSAQDMPVSNVPVGSEEPFFLISPNIAPYMYETHYMDKNMNMVFIYAEAKKATLSSLIKYGVVQRSYPFYGLQKKQIVQSWTITHTKEQSWHLNIYVQAYEALFDFKEQSSTARLWLFIFAGALICAPPDQEAMVLMSDVSCFTYDRQRRQLAVQKEASHQLECIDIQLVEDKIELVFRAYSSDAIKVFSSTLHSKKRGMPVHCFLRSELPQLAGCTIKDLKYREPTKEVSVEYVDVQGELQWYVRYSKKSRSYLRRFCEKNMDYEFCLYWLKDKLWGWFLSDKHCFSINFHKTNVGNSITLQNMRNGSVTGSTVRHEFYGDIFSKTNADTPFNCWMYTENSVSLLMAMGQNCVQVVPDSMDLVAFNLMMAPNTTHTLLHYPASQELIRDGASHIVYKRGKGAGYECSWKNLYDSRTCLIKRAYKNVYSDEISYQCNNAIFQWERVKLPDMSRQFLGKICRCPRDDPREIQLCFSVQKKCESIVRECSMLVRVGDACAIDEGLQSGFQPLPMAVQLPVVWDIGVFRADFLHFGRCQCLLSANKQPCFVIRLFSSTGKGNKLIEGGELGWEVCMCEHPMYGNAQIFEHRFNLELDFKLAKEPGKFSGLSKKFLLLPVPERSI